MLEIALAAVVIAYGVVGALASILQLAHMRRRGSSDDVSLAYLGVAGGGYLLWLAYGLVSHSLPLVVVDALGAAAMVATIGVAVKLRRGTPATTTVGDQACLERARRIAAGSAVPLTGAFEALASGQRSTRPGAAEPVR